MNQMDPRLRYRAAAISQTAEMIASFDAVPQAPRQKVELSQQAVEVAELLSDRPVSANLLTGWLRIVDFAMVAVCGLGVYAAYVSNLLRFELHYAAPLLLGAAMIVIVLQAIEGYDVRALRNFFSQFGKILIGWTVVFAGFATIAFFAKIGEDYSRVWFAGWYASGLVWFALSRAWVTRLVKGWVLDGRLERRAVVVGGGKAAEELITGLENQADNDIRICGVFDDRKSDRSPEIIAGYPKLGTIEELVEFGRRARLDMLIVSLPLTAESRVLEMLKKLWVLPVDIRLSAHSNKLRFRPRSYSYVGSVPFLDVFDKPIADWDGIAKRAFDLIFGTLALVALSPIMIGAAIAVKLDSKGPVFFRQKRHGFNNEVVSVWKFRSMYTDKSDHEVKQAVTRDDPRVTRVGRIIRKTSIDELPQLFNVLKGELSLVGPRPHAVNAQSSNRLWDQVVDGYFARHKVKPGITGWAQINGWRGEIDTPEKIKKRVEHDLYYIENWSLWFDFKILVLTPFKLLDTRNAY